MSRTALLLLVPLLLGSCAIARQDTNDPLPVDVLRDLVPGRTTAREVVERLGAPTEVVQLGRRTAYRYDATSAKSAALILVFVNFANQDARSDRLWVFFDEDDVLTHAGATLASRRTRYALPWQDVHGGESGDGR